MRIFSYILLTTLLMNAGIAYAKSPYDNSYRNEPSYSDLFHRIENHEAEIQTFEERLNTQETIIDTLRQQLMEANLSSKELFKGNAISLEKKVSSIDLNVNQLSGDMRGFQSHANETAKVLSQYKQKIGELEKQISSLRSAMDSILIALQIDEPKMISDIKTYEVKNGDSLEKIARKNKTTIKKLKELNNLVNDRIFVGQKLKLP